jgi:hypothetical protein
VLNPHERLLTVESSDCSRPSLLINLSPVWGIRQRALMDPTSSGTGAATPRRG